MWLELRKGVSLYSSEELLLFPRDILPVHPKWPVYFWAIYTGKYSSSRQIIYQK